MNTNLQSSIHDVTTRASVVDVPETLSKEPFVYGQNSLRFSRMRNSVLVETQRFLTTKRNFQNHMFPRTNTNWQIALFICQHVIVSVDKTEQRAVCYCWRFTIVKTINMTLLRRNLFVNEFDNFVSFTNSMTNAHTVIIAQ